MAVCGECGGSESENGMKKSTIMGFFLTRGDIITGTGKLSSFRRG